jgi:hypothetical protein
MRLACLLSFAFSPLLVAAEPADFARDVRPLLEEKCFRCHGAKKQEGGLRLDLRSRALAGGDSGKVIQPSNADKSLLIRRVTSMDEDRRMPPSGDRLTPDQTAKLTSWINAGAQWPDELAGDDGAKTHWAFQPIRPTSPPQVKGAVANPIDAFVLARLEKDGQTLSPEADRGTLAKRLSLDLTGLLPDPEEVERFLADRSPLAFEKLVERLLATPHFGERWSRHWLDLVRFAESDGYENDSIRANAWRYRDWVIDAFNRALPFDRFTIDQLAGDLLPKATSKQLIASGMHRNALWNSAASADKEEYRTLAVKDRTDATGTAWLGLTLGCARCHSHKYDPLTHREYYQLYAFFNAVDHRDATVPGGTTPTFQPAKRPAFVHLRGSFLQKGDDVRPSTPAFLPAFKTSGEIADRLDLARWLVDPANPLTPRVAANRIWQHLFGQGIVRTPENFGLSGERPTHPELLDWLASEFLRSGGSLKSLVRTVVLSNTYRQSSVVKGDDRDNRLLGRQNRFRVEAEIVRDLALSASGLLSQAVGGPSVVPPFPEGFLSHKFEQEALRRPGGDPHRRSVYIHVQRTLTHPGLAPFDPADPSSPCARRARSTTPVQALTLLNDPNFVECARALGSRMTRATHDRDGRLQHGFRVCLGRRPSERELAFLIELVEAQEKTGAKEEAIWTGVARTLLNLDEFITRR